MKTNTRDMQKGKKGFLKNKIQVVYLKQGFPPSPALAQSARTTKTCLFSL